MAVVLMLTVVFFGLAMVGLAVGVICKGRILHGSCRGPRPVTPDGRPLTCDHCSRGATPGDCTDSPASPSR